MTFENLITAYTAASFGSAALMIFVYFLIRKKG